MKNEKQDTATHFYIKTVPCMKQTLTHLTGHLSTSDHYREMHFHNAVKRPSTHSSWHIYKWLATRKKKKAPWQEQPFQQYDLSSLNDDRSQCDMNDWRAYFIGHATVLIQIGPYSFLTDPVWCDYVSPKQGLGPKRYRPMGIALEQLPQIDAVLLSHNHYDHMDLATLTWLVKRFDMPIYTGLRNAYYLPRHFNVIELDWWQGIKFGHQEKIQITYVPSQHGSGRGLLDQNQALWGGFSLTHQTGHAYFAGDTAYSTYFKDIYQKFGLARLALLPIGAYEPRHLMQYKHMNPDDAVQAFLDLHVQQAIAIHHRMFQLTDEAMFAPAEDLAIALQKYDCDAEQFLCLEEGQYVLA